MTAVLLLAGNPLEPARADAARLIAPAKVCPNRPASGSKAAMRKARKSMICLVNYARRAKRLPAYRVSGHLTWSAIRKARDIKRCGFSHDACGRPFEFWIRRSGYLGEGGWKLGENIAWGRKKSGSVRPIFIAWMKSQGHRKAILNKVYGDLGVGVVRGRFDGYAGARIWVLHFGDN